MGLLGSMHCLGMCGPLAMSLPVRTHHIGLKLLKYLLYNIGRIITYSIFGLLVGTISSFFAYTGLQQLLSITAGVLIILSVVVMYEPFAWLKRITSPFQSKIKQAMIYYFQHANGFSMLVLGVLNGFLPCGMIYAALIGAMATGDAVSGALFMICFGLGTVPLMLTVALAGNIIGYRWKSWLNRLSPVFAFAVGALLILRGLHVHIPSILPIELQHSTYNCP